MTTYSPYFYVIQHIRTGIYYAGYKAKNPDSSNLMKPNGYQTSSKTVIWSIIKAEGLDAFAVRKIKHFSTAKEAYDYETRFLRKIKIPNPKWYNKHSNFNWIGTFGHKHQQDTKDKISSNMLGKKHKFSPRQSLLGQKRSDEIRTKIRSALGISICNGKGEIFASGKLARAKYGISGTTLKKWLKDGIDGWHYLS